MKLKERKFKLNLQFFAEEPGAQPGTEPTPEPGSEPGAEPKSFDELLKDKAYQSEFDKRVAKALETAKGKWQTEQQKAIEEAKTEAEKLAKMNAEQKAQYEREKQEADYQKRLADLNARELKATAKETLASEGLPLELAEVLNYTDAETCKSSIEAVKTAFQSAVEKAVNEKLKDLTLNFTVKGGDNGKIFGSLTSAEIAEQLKKDGYDVSKKQIVLTSPIKFAGRYIIDVKLFVGVSTKIIVIVNVK